MQLQEPRDHLERLKCGRAALEAAPNKSIPVASHPRRVRGRACAPQAQQIHSSQPRCSSCNVSVCAPPFGRVALRRTCQRARRYTPQRKQGLIADCNTCVPDAQRPVHSDVYACVCLCVCACVCVFACACVFVCVHSPCSLTPISAPHILHGKESRKQHQPHGATLPSHAYRHSPHAPCWFAQYNRMCMRRLCDRQVRAGHEGPCGTRS